LKAEVACMLAAAETADVQEDEIFGNVIVLCRKISSEKINCQVIGSPTLPRRLC
jgi:hypothetical protein